jgi:hypothetical protein
MKKQETWIAPRTVEKEFRRGRRGLKREGGRAKADHCMTRLKQKG